MARKMPIKKRGDIEEIKKTMIASDDNFATLEKRLKEALEQKDAMNQEIQGIFRTERRDRRPHFCFG